MTEPAASINLAAGEAHSTPLDDLRSRLAKPSTEDEVLVMTVPRRKGISIRYSSVIPFEVAQNWFQTATDKKAKKFDLLKCACLGLSAQCEAIIDGGEEVRDEDGELITFMSSWLHEAVGATNDDEVVYLDAVPKFYRSDGDAIHAFNLLLADAGFDILGGGLDPMTS